jgi:transposase
LLDVEQWAQIRRMKHVEGLSQREIRRRTGLHRDTIRRALVSDEPPRYGPRPRAPVQARAIPADDRRATRRRATLSAVRIREEIDKLGYAGSMTILNVLLRELRPRYLPPPRSFQRTR